jgi:signal transduction histidine kinase
MKESPISASESAGTVVERLSERPARPPNFRCENEVLVRLAREMSSRSPALRRLVVESALQLCHAGSAGIAVFKAETGLLHSEVIAGELSGYTGCVVSMLGACSSVIESGQPQLFCAPDASFSESENSPAPICEALVVPVFAGEAAVGALWTATHGEHRFNLEDLRILTNLSTFAGAGAGGFASSGEPAPGLLLAALDRIPSGVMILDARSGRLLLLNRSAKHFLENSVQTKQPFDDSCLRDWPIAGPVRAGEIVVDAQVGISMMDGSARTLSVSAGPVHGASGEIVASVVIFDDFTERIRINAQLAAQTEELARSNTELQQFAYVISHDLQEPLRTIAGHTKLLASRYQGKLDADADELIGFVIDGAQRMQNLIHDLLMYSRVSQPGGRPWDRFPSESMLAWALMNLQAAIEDSGAVITHDPLPEIFGDQAQLAQVLQNLIGNAIKYRSAEPPRIHVSAGLSNNEWVFSVRDNGIGIESRYHERIFGVFKRLHGRDVPGTGIGLAICHKIVQRHGGRIWVDSEHAKGATFYFSLPV